MLDWDSFKNNLTHQKIAVFGLGKSGLSVVKALSQNGIAAVAWDDSEQARNKAKALGADIIDLTHIELINVDYLILSPGIHYTYEPHDVVVNAQKYNIPVIGDVELLHLIGMPCKTIGITGTNGKSTTTALMNHIVNSCGRKAIMGGNIGIPVFDIDFTKDYDFLILELSSYQLDLCPSFRPDYSMLLNITPDHLDRHGSMDAYVESKGRILEGEGVAVISIDDDFTQMLFDKNFMEGKRRYIPVSVRHHIPEGYFVRDGVLFQNHLGEDKEVANLTDLPTLKGAHNHQNIACCYIIGNEMGLNSDSIIKSLESFSGLPHRQYIVANKENILFVNDSKATNAEATAKALAAYENIYWIAGGRAKETGLQGLEIFQDKVIKAFLIGEAEEEFANFLLSHNFDVMICHDLKNATEKAVESAKEIGGEATILLSPASASWDQFSSFEERGDVFVQNVERLVG